MSKKIIATWLFFILQFNFAIEIFAAGRFQANCFGNPLSNQAIKRMYMRTRRLLLRSGRLCRMHKKKRVLFQKAIHYQLLARAVFLGRIVTKKRNKLTAALTFKARQLAKAVVVANYGRLLRKDRDHPLEKKAAQGINNIHLQQLVKTSRNLHFKMPPLLILFTRHNFCLGTDKSIRQKFHRFRR